MDSKQLKYVIEAALLAAGRPLSVDKLQDLFGTDDPPVKQDIRAALMELKSDYANRGIEVAEVASGFRIHVSGNMAHYLERLWEERPPRYSRALLETLSIIAYRQPATRGEIEEIRGVAVSTNIIRTLLERSWIRVVGHRDVPGKPALFGTTKEFLDYFNLKKLDDLPPLSELKDFESLNIQLDLSDNDIGAEGTEPDNVASLEDARAAAADSKADDDAAAGYGPEEDPGLGELDGSGPAIDDDAESEDDLMSAKVVPLSPKQFPA